MTQDTNSSSFMDRLKLSWKKHRPVFISLYALTLLIGFLIAFRAGLNLIIERHAQDEGFARDRLLIQYLVHILFAGIFPLSALAYTVFQRPGQEDDLASDLGFLGISDENNLEPTGTGTGTGTGEYHKIMKRFKTDTSQWNYAFQYALPLLATVLGLSLFFHSSELESIEPVAAAAMRYGFLGAYIYSIQYIYRRYTTLDLQPSVYMHCGIVLVAGMVFNYVAFNFIPETKPEDVSQVEGGLQAIVSFSLGYFPALAMRWFSRLAYGALGEKQRRADAIPLGLIDGISQFHESRLRDEGIDNIQNLASVKIDKLLLNTPFSLSMIMEWIDQAILFMYLDPGEIQSFRRGGVRSITDFQSQWGKFRGNKGTKKSLSDDEWKASRESRAQQLQSTPQRLDALYETTDSGANMAHVRQYWLAKGAWTERMMNEQFQMRQDEMEARYRKRRDKLGLASRAAWEPLPGTGTGDGSGSGDETDTPAAPSPADSNTGSSRRSRGSKGSR